MTPAEPRRVSDYRGPQDGPRWNCIVCGRLIGRNDSGRCGKHQAIYEHVQVDHPHTDPGDGRTECETCGKWVWPFLHSCKGIPVTAAARMRFDARRAGGDDA